MKRLNREYNDIDWVGLYNSEQFQEPDTAPSFKKIFLGGGGWRGFGREIHRFLMRDGKRNTLWIWCNDFMQKVCYTSANLGYIREIWGISANFFRLG